MRLLLEEQPGLQVAGEAADTRCLLAQVEETCPDSILLSWELAGLSGADLLRSLRKTCPGLHIIVLSSRLEARREALCAGADDFVSKLAPPEPLVAAIIAAQQKSRRSQMTEVTRERKGTWVYAAIFAVAIVALAAVATCLVVSLTLISEIPFHHIFPH